MAGKGEEAERTEEEPFPRNRREVWRREMLTMIASYLMRPCTHTTRIEPASGASPYSEYEIIKNHS